MMEPTEDKELKIRTIIERIKTLTAEDKKNRQRYATKNGLQVNFSSSWADNFENYTLDFIGSKVQSWSARTN